jgi:hypothetical protein
MPWQIFDPTVWPVTVAMSVGQLLGTASFAGYGYVVFADWRNANSKSALCETPRGSGPPSAR